MRTAYLTVTVLFSAMLIYSAVARYLRLGWILRSTARVGVPESWLPKLATLKAAAVGLLLGLVIPFIGLAATVGVTLFFVGAIITHKRDPGLPARGHRGIDICHTQFPGEDARRIRSLSVLPPAEAELDLSNTHTDEVRVLRSLIGHCFAPVYFSPSIPVSPSLIASPWRTLRARLKGRPSSRRAAIRSRL